MDVVIREATSKDDVVQLTCLAAAMFAESQFSQYDFDESKVTNLVHQLIDSEEGIAHVAEIDGAVVGGFLGIVAEHFFGRSRVSYDFGTFVLPEFRRSKVGFMLIQAYIEQAKRIGADEITIGNSTGVDTDRVTSLFEQMGFVRYGTNMRMKG